MKIGITTRVVVSENETRDCIDQSWFKYFDKIGQTIIPIPNTLENPVDYIKSLNIKGIILSGGNDINGLENAENVSLDRDKTEYLIIKYATIYNIPLVGVCRGMQMINFFFNGSFCRISKHVNVNHNLIRTNEHIKFPDFFKVNSFHNYAIPIDKIGRGLIATYLCEESFVESFVHEHYSIAGIMCHPEREIIQNESDIELFKQILKF